MPDAVSVTTTFAPDLLRGRTGMITGGGTGIGLHLAHALTDLGAKVLLASRSEEHLTEAVSEIRSHGGEADARAINVRDPRSVADLFAWADAEHGPVDFLLNNAGANFMAPAVTISERGWAAILDTVIHGAAYCAREAARRMIARGDGGRIIQMGGANGWNGSPLMAPSGAGKSSLRALTRSLAVEWAPHQITVNEVVPGPVDTEGARERLWPTEAVRADIIRRVPMGRMVIPDDVIGPVVFLLSDAAAFVTGISLVVDGANRLWTQRVEEVGARERGEAE